MLVALKPNRLPINLLIEVETFGRTGCQGHETLTQRCAPDAAPGHTAGACERESGLFATRVLVLTYGARIPSMSQILPLLPRSRSS